MNNKILSSSLSPFNKNLCKNKVALVTGGGTGIGFEIAYQLGKHGCEIVIMGRRQKYLDDALRKIHKAGISAISHSGDVRKVEDVQEAVNKAVYYFGSLDILVNSAAGNFLAPAEDLTPNGFKTVMDIDALGVYTCSWVAHKELKKSGNGLIINISATLHYGARWYQAHASAAKASIDSLTRSLALEWGMYGIRVVGIAPGATADTPGFTKLIGGVNNKRVENWLNKYVSLKRIGTKFELAMTALFISWNEYITGETIVVDGGSWFYNPPDIPLEKVKEISNCVEKKSRDMKGNTSELPSSKL